MRVLVDSNILVDIDRGKEEVIELMEMLTELNADLFISTISVSEFLVGVCIQDKLEKSRLVDGRELLAQFKYVNFDPQIAEIAAERIACKLKSGKHIEYQDEIIAATSLFLKVNYLLTNNIKHYSSMENAINTQDLLKKFKQ